jgi:hypothetical protein
MNRTEGGPDSLMVSHVFWFRQMDSCDFSLVFCKISLALPSLRVHSCAQSCGELRTL